MSADLDNLLPHVRTVVRQFQQIFPEFTVISGYRDPNHNHSVGGAGDSRHMHRDAFDFQPAPGTPPERKADAVNWLRSQGAQGFGTYDRDGSEFHADWRTTGPAMWGPNRSRTSLGATPSWFQDIAGDHLSGVAPSKQYATVPPGSIPNTRTALVGGDTARMVYDKLTSLGVPSKTAAGAVGSLMGESGRGLNTGALNRGDGADGSDSIGMGQWNGSRATALKRVAGEMGLPWTDPRVQVEHLGRELQGTHSYVLRDLKNGPDSIDRGANVWTGRYEVADPAMAHQDRRIQNGYAFANQLANAPTQVAANGAYAPGGQPARPYVEAQPQTGAFGGYANMQAPSLGGDTARPIGASPVAQATPAAPVTALTSGPQAGGPTRPWGSDTPAPAAVTPQTTTTGSVAAAEANPQSARYWPQDPRDPWSTTTPSATGDTLPKRPTGSSPIASMANQILAPDTAFTPPTWQTQTPQIPQTPNATGSTAAPAMPDSGGDNPLIIRHIRPQSQDSAPAPQTVPLAPQRPTDAQLAQVPQDVPLPPQRPSDDQLFARPVGSSPVQRGWQDYEWITNPDGSIGTQPWINPVPHYEPPTGGGLFGALGLTD